MNARLALERVREFFSADPASDQAWFWDEVWLAGEREADEDIKQGRTSTSLSTDEFRASLQPHRADL
jgi:hypothetical protein